MSTDLDLIDAGIMAFAESSREEIAEYLAAINALKEKINSAKESRRSVMRQLLNRIPDYDAKKDISAELYWNYEDVFDAETLSRPLGLKANALCHAVRGYAMKLKCHDCQRIVDYYPTSRANAQMHKSWGTCVCEECEARRQQHWTQVAEITAQRQATIEVLRNMPYQDYLQTEHWQKLRREMLRRARYRCQVCNTSAELHVHHRTYENRGDERYGDLVVLCADCHTTFHQNGRVQS